MTDDTLTMAPPGASPSSMSGTAARTQGVAGADVEVEGLLQEAGRGVEQGTGHGAPEVVDDDVQPAQLVPGRPGQRGHQRRHR